MPIVQSFKKNRHLHRAYKLISRSLYFPPFVVLLAILIITIWPWQNARQTRDSNFNQSVKERIDTVQANLAERFNVYHTSLQSGAGLFQTNADITKEQWNSFFQYKQLVTNRTGIQGTGYSKVFTAEQYQQVQATMRSQGVENFAIRPGVLDPELNSAVLFLFSNSGNNTSATGFITLGIMGYTKRASFKTAVALSQISEFSLVFVVACVHGNFARPEVQAVIGLTALITFAGSAYLMKYDDELYTKLEKHLRLFERKVTKLEQKGSLQNYSVVLFGYRKGGAEFIRTFRAMKKRFVVVDYDPDAVELIERQHVNFLYGDATDVELIEELNLDKSKLVVSTISDFATNEFLASWLKANNPGAVFVASADTAYHAAHLYSEGAAYVMMPHFIGSEKISTFIKRTGFKKSEFNKFREKHLHYLETHYSEEPA